MKRSRASPYEAAMRRLERRKALNRLNALKSTGPKSQEGKSRSAQNARTHGFTAQKENWEVIGGDDEAFCALILGRAQDIPDRPPEGGELNLLARSLYILQIRLNYIQREKAKIYAELKRPTSKLALASSVNPFISGKRQSQRIIAELRSNASGSTQIRRLAKVSRILRSVGKDEPDRVNLLKKLSRYERETLAQLRKMTRRIAALKAHVTEQIVPRNPKSSPTEPKAKDRP